MKKIIILLSALLLVTFSACSNKAAEDNKAALEKAELEKAKVEAELAKVKAEAAKAEAETAKAEAETAKAEAETAKADADAVIAEAQNIINNPDEPGNLPVFDGDFAPKGLVLEMGVRPVKDIEVMRVTGFEDGVYRVDELFDGTIAFSTERRNSIEHSEAAIKDAISRFAPNAREISFGKDQTMSARLSYPSWKIEYLTGSNEDTRKNIDYYVQAENYDYRFHTSVGADQYDDNTHHLTAWFENLKMVEE